MTTNRIVFTSIILRSRKKSQTHISKQLNTNKGKWKKIKILSCTLGEGILSLAASPQLIMPLKQPQHDKLIGCCIVFRNSFLVMMNKTT